MNNRIKQIRNHLKLSQFGFGEKIGVTNAAISKIEVGENNVSNQVISAICREFNVSAKWLETGEGEMFVQLEYRDQVKKAVDSVLSTDDEFILGAFKLLADMPPEAWQKAKEFIDKLK